MIIAPLGLYQTVKASYMQTETKLLLRALSCRTMQALQGAKGKRPEKAEGKGPQGPKKTS